MSNCKNCREPKEYEHEELCSVCWHAEDAHSWGPDDEVVITNWEDEERWMLDDEMQRLNSFMREDY